MSKVWNMPEFQMSGDDYQRWATNKGYPNFSGKEILDLLGTTKPTMKMKTNTGSEEDIKLDVKNQWMVNVDLPSKMVTVDGKKKKIYFIVGTSPKSKGAVYFSEDDLRASKGWKDFADKMSALVKAAQEDYYNSLRLELRKNLPPAAVKALEDNILQFVEEKDFKKLHDWFVAAGFSDVPTVEELKKFASLSGFTKSSGADGWGHSTGTAVKIDWKNKKFSEYGWSSDD